MRTLAIASIVLQLALFCAPRAAAAASLQEVQGFGNNPSNAKMFIYVPDKLAASPPVLVAIHYCGGSANAFFTGTGYRALSDQYGFIVIYPQTTSSDGCFDVHSDATLKHDGGSDSAAIASMVRYTISKYAADANRVYVTGTSSGAMMTNVMLGAYPDMFRAGAAFAGVPYACFAGTSGWNSACAQGQTTKTGQQWGDLVRAGYPSYAGPRPRVQLWHGDQDETLNFHNFGEEIKEWTNVLGVSETPTSTEKNAPQSGWTRTRYADSAGVVRVEAILEAGMTHNLTVPANEVARFFGLDGHDDPGGNAGSSGGASGAGSSGRGGSSGSAGSAGRSGMSGASGMGSGQAAANGGVAGNPSRSAGSGASPSAGVAGRSGSGGGTATSNGTGGAATAMRASAAGSGQSGEAALGVAGTSSNGSAPPTGKASGSCSVQSGRAHGGAMPALMMIGVLGAARLRRRKRRLAGVGVSCVMLAALGCSSSNSDANGNPDQSAGASGGDVAGIGGATSIAGNGTGAGARAGSGSTSSIGTAGSGGRSTSAGAAATSAAGTAGKGSSTGGAAGAAGRMMNTSGAGGTSTAGRGAAGASGRGTSGTGAGGTTSALTRFVGNITTSGQVRSDFAMYWNQITPENEGKWGSVEATRNQMNWAGLDRVHDYAKQHGVLFKQHTFVWGSQQPSWIGGLSASDQAKEVEEWIRLFCERYPDVDLIDVVNEPPPHTMPPYMNALGGAGSSGYDWIVQAFKWAHQYCPNAILIMNDYNNIEYSADNAHFIQIVNAIKAAGAPIDAIGCQAHDAAKQPTATVKGFLDKLAATGLPLYITEFDIDYADDNQQKTAMQNTFTMFWNDADIKGVTIWGYIVGATWRNDTGLMTSSGQMRPAMTWLMDFIGR